MKTLLGCLIVSKTVRFFGLVQDAGIVIGRFHEPASIPAAIVGNIVRDVRGLNFVAPGGVVLGMAGSLRRSVVTVFGHQLSKCVPFPGFFGIFACSSSVNFPGGCIQKHPGWNFSANLATIPSTLLNQAFCTLSKVILQFCTSGKPEPLRAIFERS